MASNRSLYDPTMTVKEDLMLTVDLLQGDGRVWFEHVELVKCPALDGEKPLH